MCFFLLWVNFCISDEQSEKLMYYPQLPKFVEFCIIFETDKENPLPEIHSFGNFDEFEYSSDHTIMSDSVMHLCWNRKKEHLTEIICYHMQKVPVKFFAYPSDINSIEHESGMWTKEDIKKAVDSLFTWFSHEWIDYITANPFIPSNYPILSLKFWCGEPSELFEQINDICIE